MRHSIDFLDNTSTFSFNYFLFYLLKRHQRFYHSIFLAFFIGTVFYRQITAVFHKRSILFRIYIIYELNRLRIALVQTPTKPTAITKHTYRTYSGSAIVLC